MLAYIKDIEVCDDDGKVIGNLVNTIDDVFTWNPREDIGAYVHEFRFITKLLESGFKDIQFSDNGFEHYNSNKLEIKVI